MKKIQFFIKGMHCASCVYVNEQALKKIPGVKNVVVNLATSKVTIETEGQVNLNLIKKAVEELGYQAIFDEEKSLDEKMKKERKKEFQRLKNKMIISLFLSSLIVWGSFPVLMKTSPAIFKNYFFQFLAASIVQFFGGLDFYQAAISALKNRLANMDVLVSIGTTIAYLYSAVLIFLPKLFTSSMTEFMPYFDVSAVIISLVLLGRYLEAKAKSKTNEAIKKLIGLQPKEATIVENF